MLNRKFFKSALGAFFVSAGFSMPHPVFAQQDASKSNALANYQSGFYVGIQGGIGWIDDGDGPDRFMDKVVERGREYNAKKSSSESKYGGSVLLGYSF